MPLQRVMSLLYLLTAAAIGRHNNVDVVHDKECAEKCYPSMFFLGADLGIRETIRERQEEFDYACLKVKTGPHCHKFCPLGRYSFVMDDLAALCQGPSYIDIRDHMIPCDATRDEPICDNDCFQYQCSINAIKNECGTQAARGFARWTKYVLRDLFLTDTDPVLFTKECTAKLKNLLSKLDEEYPVTTKSSRLGQRTSPTQPLSTTVTTILEKPQSDSDNRHVTNSVTQHIIMLYVLPVVLVALSV